MEARLIEDRLKRAVDAGESVTLLLRGNHRLVVLDASVQTSQASGESCFDITGNIGIDGDPPAHGLISVSSGDIASIFVAHESPSSP